MTAAPSDAIAATLEATLAELHGCRLCRDAPRHGPALPHEPRPIIQFSTTARLCIASQAPGIRAHLSGVPFNDPSGVRLRNWLGLERERFYDASNVAIVPMGHCFPGHDATGGDLPPRRECAETWRARMFGHLPALDLILLIGLHAQNWHLPDDRRALTAIVADWRAILAHPRRPRVLPLPHPSWRNNGWLKRHPWFEQDVLPALRAEVTRVLAQR